MTSLRDLTIVIPSYGRQDFLARQISYWSNSSAHILIVDGSPTSLVPQGLAPNIDYRHVPRDFFDRMTLASDVVKTKYVALLGDDDLYLQSGLARCVEHLEWHRKDVGVVGRSLYFFFQEGRVFAQEKNPESSNYPDSIKTGLERLRNYYHEGKIGAIAYGVYRSEPWKQAIWDTYRDRYSCGYVYDTYLRTTLTYAGNISVCESLTWMCSGENPPIRDSSSFNRKLDLINWLTEPEWKKERDKYRTSLVSSLVRHGIDGIGELDGAVDEILKTLTDRYTEKLSARLSITARAKSLLLVVVPRPVRKVLKKFLPDGIKSSFGWEGSDVSSVAKGMASRGISINQRELEEFEQLVLRFHAV